MTHYVRDFVIRYYYECHVLSFWFYVHNTTDLIQSFMFIALCASVVLCASQQLMNYESMVAFAYAVVDIGLVFVYTIVG